MRKLWARFRQWLIPPVFKDDAEKTELSRLLYPLLGGLLGAVLVYVLSLLFTPEPLPPLVLLAVVVLGLVFSVSLILVRAGYVSAVGVALIVVMWIVCSTLILWFGGIHDEMVAGYYVVLLVAGSVLGARGLVVVTAASGAVLTLAFVLERAGILDPSGLLPSSLQDWLVVLLILVAGGLFQRYAVRRVARASQEIQESRQQVEVARAALEANQASLELESKRLYRKLGASIAVTREASSSAGDTDTLLTRLVRVIGSEFDVYHTAIFWIDPTDTWLVLQAASSEVGMRLLEQGHRVPKDSGLLGEVVTTGEGRILANIDTGASPWLSSDLWQTRSEMAVPLRLIQDSGEAEQIIGVLDIQSSESGAFGPEDLIVLRALADQVALAVRNARLLQEAQQSVAAAQRVYGETTAAAWEKLLSQSRDMTFVSGAQALRQQTPSSGVVSIPVRVAGQSIGAVDVHLPPESGEWTRDRQDVLEQLVAQLSQAVERARLYQETQNAAALEQRIGEVTSRIRAEVEIEDVLERALAELGQALSADRGVAFLSLSRTEAGASGGEDGHE